MKRILAFCVPVLVGNLFQQLYNLADSFLVGRILGVDPFAAVGSTGALNFLVLGFALGVCSGMSIPLAQSFGAGDYIGMRRKAGQMVWLGLGLSLLLTAAAALWTDDLLRLTRTPEEIFDEAYRYILIVFLGAGATILYNQLSAVLRALGDSRTPLKFLMTTVVLNVALDVFFMRVLGMGVEGAALATVVSQLVSGLACLIYIAKHVPSLRLCRQELRADAGLMAAIAGIGLPMGAQFAITAVGSVMIQGAVNGLGTAAVAAVSVATKVHSLVSAPLDTCGVAMATYCGQNLGAGDIRRVRRGVRSVTLAAMVYCGAALCVLFLFGTELCGFFLDTATPELLGLARRYLLSCGCAYPMLAAIFIFRNALQGMGFSRQAMAAGAAELSARAIAAFGLVGPLGFRAVCLAGPLAWAFADAVLLLLYRAELGRLGAGPENAGERRQQAALRLKRARAR